IPARQTYSHSASEGRRIASPLSRRPSRRSSCVTLRQNATASSQLTFSTELRGPFQRDGFSPVIAWYSSCVTSYLASANGLFSVTLWAGCSLAGPSLPEPITNDAGNLPLPGVIGTNSSANRLRIASAFAPWPPA